MTEESLAERGCAVLLRRDEGLAPLDGVAQCLKSTHLPPPQGTEMANMGGLWSGRGRGPAGACW